MNLGLITWKETRKPTQHECKLRLQEEGYDVTEWNDPPGSNYQTHQHRHDECICIVEGSMEFEIESLRYKLQPGDCLYLPKFTSHSAVVPQNQSVRYLIGHK